MTDYTELKRLASASKNWGGEVCEGRWYAVECFKRPYFSAQDAEFIAACDPGRVLALIAENESAHKHWQNESNNVQVLVAEVSRLKAENEPLRKALRNCADELSAEIICKHGGQKLEDMHPVTRRLYERDMAAVVEARAAMGKGEQS